MGNLTDDTVPTLTHPTHPTDLTDLCEICHKKVKIYAVQCKCKRILCKNHVFPKNHDCDFDYKNEGKLMLEKTLVAVQSQKVDKI